MTEKDFTEAESIAARTIRLASPNEIGTVCDILASAFTDDPIMAWLSGHPQIYSALFRSEAEALYKKHGLVYLNGDNTGAAMWLPAGIPHKAPFHWRMLSVAWKLVSTSGFASLKRGMVLDTIFEEQHIKEPHFYLHAIGAAYNNQGRGIGSALLKTGLKACDEQGMPAYLESSNIKNNVLYERYGFKVIAETTLPDNGPGIWFMRREAQGNE